MKPNTSERIKELIKLIQYHQGLYYNGEPEISDADFDLLWDELTSLDPENPILHKVGSDSSVIKEMHIIPMGSQSKVTEDDMFLDWANETGFTEFVLEHKLDGSSIELQYVDGVFTKAVTRGDGIIGEDVTQNARSMQGVQPVIPVKFTGSFRGEVLMYKDIREKFFPDKANCRNAANGIMKRKDDTNAKHLVIICYDAAPLGVYNLINKTINKSKFTLPFSDEIEKIMWIKSLGFNTVDMTVVSKAQDVISYRNALTKARDKLPYIIDGIVIKSRKIDPYDMIKSRPEKQVAFKFPLEKLTSPLIDVEWSESGVIYTPIGIIEPVQIAGTTVQRANLCNPNIIRNMKLKIGSIVVVVKRGEIIPKIEYVMSTPNDAKEIEIPKICSCGTPLIDEGTRLYCPSPVCPKRMVHRIEKWIDTVDIRDFGPATVDTLFSAGRLRSIKDMYTLTEEELIGYGFGRKISARLIASIKKNTEVTFEQFIAGFDIEGVGVTLMEKIVAAGYDSYDKLKRVSMSDISTVQGFSDIMAERLYSGIRALKDEIEDILKLNILKFKIKTFVDTSLQDKVFCFTGELNSMNRDDAATIVKSHGGKVSSSVTRDTTYLVTNDTESGSKKNELANKFGVTIIDEKTFIDLIGE